jgi:uncharacterized membrane protein
MCIETKLQRWQSAGLLSSKQAHEIAEFEENRKHFYPQKAILMLAGFLIGLGIISLVAVNWDRIDGSVKICFGFCLMSMAAFATWIFYAKNNRRNFEACLFVFSLLFAAQTGMIVQIFHLQPTPEGPLFLWSLPLLPLVFFCRSKVLPMIWIPVTGAALWRLMSDTTFFAAFEKVWPLSVSLLLLMILLIFYQLSEVVFSENAALGWRRASVFWLAIGFIVQVLATDLVSSERLIWFHGGSDLILDVLYLLVPIAAASAFLGWKKNKLYLPAALLLVIAAGHVFDLGFIETVSAAACVGAYAYYTKRWRLLDVSVACIAFRIFVYYADDILDLRSGLSFIVSGSLLMICLYIWQKVSIRWKRR